MREKRYSCEHQIKDAQQIVEIFHKEIQVQTKKLKIIESNLKKNEDELNMFMVFIFNNVFLIERIISFTQLYYIVIILHSQLISVNSSRNNKN